MNPQEPIVVGSQLPTKSTKKHNIIIAGLVVAIAVLSVVAVRLAADKNKSITPVTATTTNKILAIGETETGGLEESGISANAGDLNVRTNEEVLGGDQLEGVSKTKSGSLTVNFKDHRGWTYYGPEGKDRITGFQVITESNKDYEPATLIVNATSIDLKKCSITHKYVSDATGKVTDETIAEVLKEQVVKAYDGDHSYTVNCKDGTGTTLTAGWAFRVSDRNPKACKDATFTEAAVTATTLATLKSGIIGTWEGCVKTPWVPMYKVSITFKADGTYSAVSDEVLDGVEMNAMYYGSEKDNPLKKYSLSGVTNGTGSGGIVIFFDGSNTTTDDSLEDIKLMGNKLSFNMFHSGYGPLTFQLTRK